MFGSFHGLYYQLLFSSEHILLSRRSKQTPDSFYLSSSQVFSNFIRVSSVDLASGTQKNVIGMQGQLLCWSLFFFMNKNENWYFHLAQWHVFQLKILNIMLSFQIIELVCGWKRFRCSVSCVCFLLILLVLLGWKDQLLNCSMVCKAM